MDPVRAAFEMMKERLRPPPVKSSGQLAADQMLEEERAHEAYLYKLAVLEVIRGLDEKWAAATSVDRG